MLKHFFSFLLVVSFLACGMIFAQDAAAPAPAAEAPVTATAVAEGSASETAKADLAAMTYEDLVAYLSSLSADDFGTVVVEAVKSGDRYVARRVLSAANQVIAKADAEKVAALVSAVEARGEGVVVVRNNVIGVAVAPMPNSLNQKFDAANKVETRLEVPPATPTYSAGAAM